MYPTQFAEYLRDWLAEADHPGLERVRTCADLGRWEQPVGVAATLTDGWTLILQCVGTYPPGGAAGDDPDSPPPAPFTGSWEDRDDYKTARKAYEAEVAAWSGVKTRQPQATVASLLAVVVEAVKRADSPKVASVDIPDGRLTVKVTFTDGSAVHGLAAGYLAPGAVDLAHKAHDVPEGWR